MNSAFPPGTAISDAAAPKPTNCSCCCCSCCSCCSMPVVVTLIRSTTGDGHACARLLPFSDRRAGAVAWLVLLLPAATHEVPAAPTATAAAPELGGPAGPPSLLAELARYRLAWWPVRRYSTWEGGPHAPEPGDASKPHTALVLTLRCTPPPPSQLSTSAGGSPAAAATGITATLVPWPGRHTLRIAPAGPEGPATPGPAPAPAPDPAPDPIPAVASSPTTGAEVGQGPAPSSPCRTAAAPRAGSARAASAALEPLL